MQLFLWNTSHSCSMTTVQLLPGSQTTVAVVPFSNADLVDQAVSSLCQSNRISLAIKANKSAEVVLLQMSAGDRTFLFQRAQREDLPIALRLLLTHQDYEKV
jgi:hypothetical protein